MFVVTSSDDSQDTTCDVGNCTLRGAIVASNKSPEDDTITFDISPQDGGFNGQWWTIGLSSVLPVVTGRNTTIDGFSQTANRGDTNPGLLGTGGVVGVDRIPLP